MYAEVEPCPAVVNTTSGVWWLTADRAPALLPATDTVAQVLGWNADSTLVVLGTPIVTDDGVAVPLQHLDPATGARTERQYLPTLNVAMDPQGHVVAFATSRELGLFRAEGEAPSIIAQDIGTPRGHVFWLPDAATVGLVVEAQASAVLALFDVTTGNRRDLPLPASPASVLSMFAQPQPSPDSTHIALALQDDDASAERLLPGERLEVLAVADGRTVLTLPGLTNPVWATPELLYAVRNTRDGGQLVRIAVPDGSVTDVLQHPTPLFAPVLTPDGTQALVGTYDPNVPLLQRVSFAPDVVLHVDLATSPPTVRPVPFGQPVLLAITHGRPLVWQGCPHVAS